MNELREISCVCMCAAAADAQNETKWAHERKKDIVFPFRFNRLKYRLKFQKKNYVITYLKCKILLDTFEPG